MFAPFHLKTYLKLGQLFHQLLLLLGVAQRGDDVEEHLQQVQTLSGHVGQSEDRRDAARKTQQRLMFKTEIRIEKTKNKTSLESSMLTFQMMNIIEDNCTLAK